MALKKGSKEAKAWGRKMARARGLKSKPKSKSTSPKRRKAIKSNPKKMVRRKAKTKKRTSKRTSMRVLGINTAKAMGPLLYGAGREKISNMIAPYTSRIPIAGASDEIGMLAALWAGKKYLVKGKGPLRDALNAGQNIELARLGEMLANNQLNFGGLFKGGSAAPSGGFGR